MRFRAYFNIFFFTFLATIFVAHFALAWDEWEDPSANPPQSNIFPLIYNQSPTPSQNSQLNGRFTIDADSTNIGLFILNTHNHNPEIDIGASTTDNSHWAIYNNLSDNQLRFWNQGADNLLVLTPDGKVGIGTTTPQEQLSLSGNIALPNTTHSNLNGIIYRGTSTFIHDFNYGNNGTVTTEGHNLFIGENAGNLTMGQNATKSYQASNNVGVGRNALHSFDNSHFSDVGYENVAIGSFAFNGVTNSTGNTAIESHLDGELGEYNVLGRFFGEDYPGYQFYKFYKKNVIIGSHSLSGANCSFDVDGCKFVFSNVVIGRSTMNRYSEQYASTYSTTGTSTHDVVAIGGYVLYDVEPGSANETIAIGYGVGWHASGTANIFFTTGGSNLGTINNTEDLEDSVAYDAHGNYNINIGSQSFDRYYGDYNIGVGFGVLGYSFHENQNKGLYNIAMGYEVGAQTQGAHDNIAIGHKALYLMGSSSLNIAIGYHVSNGYGDSDNPDKNTKSNILIGGYVCGEKSVGVSGLIQIGRQNSKICGEDNSNNVYIGAYSGLYMIGNHNIALGVNALKGDDAWGAQDYGNYNIAVGDGALKHLKLGDYNIALGYHSAHDVFYGDEEITVRATSTIVIGSNALIAHSTDYASTGSSTVNRIIIGFNTASYRSDVFVLGNDNIATTALKGFVGVGTTSPLARLHVAGNIEVSGDFYAKSIHYTSDEKLKTNIQSIQNALEKIKKLRGVEFNWKNESANSKKHLGLIAQEVEKVFPEAVSTDKNGYKSVEYANLIAPLVETLKQQQEILDKQEREINKLLKMKNK